MPFAIQDDGFVGTIADACHSDDRGTPYSIRDLVSHIRSFPTVQDARRAFREALNRQHMLCERIEHDIEHVQSLFPGESGLPADISQSVPALESEVQKLSQDLLSVERSVKECEAGSAAHDTLQAFHVNPKLLTMLSADQQQRGQGTQGMPQGEGEAVE